MDEHKFFEDLLNLPGLRVTSVHHESSKIILHCSLDKGVVHCPSCGGETALVNQYKTRRVRDLDISGKEVWLHLRLGQYTCVPCNRHFHSPCDWLLPGKRYTKRQAKWVFELCGKQAFSEAGALVNMHAKTVERLYYEQAGAQLQLRKRYQEVRKLGIDEVSNRKGKKDYICVLVDLDRGIELDILPNRKKSTLEAHFKQLGEGFCAQIEVVCCDMWKPYIEVAKTCFPQAELVIDRFHVVKSLNEVLDQFRKELRRKSPEEEVFQPIKWLLFKKPACLGDTQKDQVEKALSQSWKLDELYTLRNSFNAIFDLAKDPMDCEHQLSYWIEHAQQIAYPPLDKFLKTLKNWMKPISAFATCRTTNAVTEGLNNYLRYFKRISFGLPNFEHMRIRVLMASQ